MISCRNFSFTPTKHWFSIAVVFFPRMFIFVFDSPLSQWLFISVDTSGIKCTSFCSWPSPIRMNCKCRSICSHSIYKSFGLQSFMIIHTVCKFFLEVRTHSHCPTYTHRHDIICNINICSFWLSISVSVVTTVSGGKSKPSWSETLVSETADLENWRSDVEFLEFTYTICVNSLRIP